MSLLHAQTYQNAMLGQPIVHANFSNVIFILIILLHVSSIFIILLNSQQKHNYNYFTNYHAPTCFDTRDITFVHLLINAISITVCI
jgi:hypothetical protein